MYLKKEIGFSKMKDNDWFSTNNNHEHIYINNNDIISGYYSLAIVGFIKTKFTLYVSYYDKNILLIKEKFIYRLILWK